MSISVPVVLSFLIFPDVSSQRLLGRRGTIATLGLLIFQIVVWTPVLIVINPGLHQVLSLLVLPVAIVLVFTYLASRLPATDPSRRLLGFFGRPVVLAVAAVFFFVFTFAPILKFFAFPFLPISTPYDLVYQADSSGILATFYPMVLAALAVAFFVRYSLGKEQLLAVLVGVMFIPLVSGLAPFDLPAGGPIAALIYLACIFAAWNKIRKR